MAFIKTSNSWLPGSRSFLERSTMFRVTKPTVQLSYRQLFESLTESFRAGHYKSGQSFPNSRQLAGLTGASPFDSLKVVTHLLKAGAVRQLTSGQLVVARAGFGAGTGSEC